MTLTRTSVHDGTALHVRFDGRSDELTLGTLGLDRQAGDQTIKQAVARYYERPVHAFDDYVLARYEHAVVLRPEAIYG
jgi:hypothetical protein